MLASVRMCILHKIVESMVCSFAKKKKNTSSKYRKGKLGRVLIGAAIGLLSVDLRQQSMQSGDSLPTIEKFKARWPSVCRLSPTERTTLSESKCCFSSYEVGRLSADSRPTIAQRQTDLILKQSTDHKTYMYN